MSTKGTIKVQNLSSGPISVAVWKSKDVGGAGIFGNIGGDNSTYTLEKEKTMEWSRSWTSNAAAAYFLGGPVAAGRIATEGSGIRVDFTLRTGKTYVMVPRPGVLVVDDHAIKNGVSGKVIYQYAKPAKTDVAKVRQVWVCKDISLETAEQEFELTTSNVALEKLTTSLQSKIATGLKASGTIQGVGLEATVNHEISKASGDEKSHQITSSKKINTKSPKGIRHFFYEKNIEIDFGGRVLTITQDQIVHTKPMKETKSFKVDNRHVKEMSEVLGMDLFKPVEKK